jgi:hypothetical protein
MAECAWYIIRRLILTDHAKEASGSMTVVTPEIRYTQYQGEQELPSIISLIENELSEPYVCEPFEFV